MSLLGYCVVFYFRLILFVLNYFLQQRRSNFFNLHLVTTGKSCHLKF